MAVVTGAATPPTSSNAAQLCVMPPGPCTLAVTNVSGGVAFIGTGATKPAVSVLTAEGFALPNNSAPLILQGYNGSAGATVWVGATGTVSSLVTFILSTPQ